MELTVEDVKNAIEYGRRIGKAESELSNPEIDWRQATNFLNGAVRAREEQDKNWKALSSVQGHRIKSLRRWLFITAWMAIIEAVFLLLR